MLTQDHLRESAGELLTLLQKVEFTPSELQPFEDYGQVLDLLLMRLLLLALDSGTVEGVVINR